MTVTEHTKGFDVAWISDVGSADRDNVPNSWLDLSLSMNVNVGTFGSGLVDTVRTGLIVANPIDCLADVLVASLEVAEGCECTCVAEISVSKSVVEASSSTAVPELNMIDGTTSSVEDEKEGIKLETDELEEYGTDETASVGVGFGRTESVSADVSVGTIERVWNDCVEDGASVEVSI